jgi:hypothetical protein
MRPRDDDADTAMLNRSTYRSLGSNEAAAKAPRRPVWLPISVPVVLVLR